MTNFHGMAAASAHATAGVSSAATHAGAKAFGGPFASPVYRRFFFGGLLGFTALWTQLITRSWLIQQMTDSPFLVALIPVTMMLPMLLLSLPAGVVADRFDRRKIIIFGEALAFSGYAALALISIAGGLQVWHVLALSALTGMTMAFTAPSRMALVPSLVPAADVRRAIGLSAVIFTLSQVLGPAMGGVLIGRLGVNYALVASLFFSFPALLLYISVRAVREPSRSGTAGAAISSIRHGFAYTRRDPALRSMLFSALVVVVTVGTWAALMPTFAGDVLGQGAEVLGLLVMAVGAGAFTGAILVVSLGDRIPHGKVESFAVGVLAVAVLGFALSPSLPLSLVLALIAGLGQTTFMVTNMTVVQLAAPDEYRGRVLSIRYLVIGMQPLGVLALGVLAEVIGPQAAVAAAALLGAAAYTAVQLRTRPHRKLAEGHELPAAVSGSERPGR